MKKIKITEQVATGIFGGETDAEQTRAANKYAELMEKHLEDFCGQYYSEYALTIDLSVENVSGAAAHLAVFVTSNDTDLESCLTEGEIEEEILNEGEFYASEIEMDIYL